MTASAHTTSDHEGQRSLDADVLIVGARAAGASTALLLARAGLDVIVVERSRYGVDTLSTHALMRGAVIQLRRWGLLDTLISAGTPPIPRATFHDPLGSTTIDFPDDPLYAPRRTVLDPTLVDAAHRAGARVHYGLTALDVQRDRSGRVRGVLARDRFGRDVDIRARLVVGADGYHSVVARAVDAPVERVGRGAASYMYRYWSGVDSDGYQTMFNPTATAGLIPTNEGLTAVFVGASAERFAVRDADLYTSLLREANPTVAQRVLSGSAVGPTRRFNARPGCMRLPYGPGWALVGDAGYWKDPITGHGLTDALRDAELLARATLAGFDGGDIDDALTWYGLERDHLSQDLFDVTDRLARADWTDDEIGGLLRAFSASMNAEVEALKQLGPWPPQSPDQPSTLLDLAATT